MPAQTQSHIEDSEEFTVYKSPRVSEMTMDSNERSNMPQSVFWSSYPGETTAEVSTEEVGNTVIKQEDIAALSAVTPQTKSVKKSEVAGSIISIEDISVVCEVYLESSQERTMIVRLPKSLFPEDIFYGTPITITYHKDLSGIRRPGVTLRKIVQTERMAQEDREMEAFIKNL
jgi:hypothetical protein